jgi:hypothetical protein
MAVKFDSPYFNFALETRDQGSQRVKRTREEVMWVAWGRFTFYMFRGEKLLKWQKGDKKKRVRKQAEVCAG